MSTIIHTVLVCDDRQELRDVLRDLLAEIPTVTQIGETIDAVSCLESVRLLQPDLLILDHSIPQGGSHVAKSARMMNPGMHIIVFSGRDEPALQREMLDAGANQYVVKTGRIQPLLDSIARACAELDSGSGRTENSLTNGIHGFHL